MRQIISGILFLCVLTSFSHALEVIIDNSDPGCRADDGWTTATVNCYGPNKFMHSKGSGLDKVTWTTRLDPGWYRLDFRINSNSSYATDARYSIIHRDGTDNLTVNQQRTSSGWFILGGAYYIDGVTTVTLTDEFTDGNNVVADAIRFLSIFSFVHMSDSHVGYSRGTSNTTAVANELKTLGRMQMASYNFYAPPPAFAIHTGDFTEYGQEYWNTLMGIFTNMPFPIYFTSGNHDSTWSSCREKIRTRHGAPFYSFDYYDRGTRFHFVGLNTPVIQSPRAAIAREEMEWLTQDLAALEPNTPIFVFLHHPINGDSDPKPYDAYRLLETLRPYNAVMILYGHGHSFSQTTFDNIRIVQGGSTYNDTTNIGGYNIVTIAHNKLHVAKKICGEATAATGLINNMSIPAVPAYPVITVSSPAKDSVLESSSVNVSASIAPLSSTVTNVDVEFDGDDNWRAMAGTNYGPYSTSIGLTGLIHGRHWIRVRFTMSDGKIYYKTVPFWVWDDFLKPKWIVDLGASSLGMPAVADDKVYIGDNGGIFRCVNASSGAEVWKVNLPSDIVSSPAVADGRVIFGCGDSKAYCLDANTGAALWSKSCSGPVYAPPNISGTTVYIGSIGTTATNAYLYSINAATGSENWKFASYSIETKPFVLGGTVFFGNWNSYFYAINTSNGTQKWRYQRNTSRYYSPADSWPVASASANRVFVADREYYLNAINITTGVADWTRSGVYSQALTPDGVDMLLRNSGGTLERTTFGNTAVWSRSASLDSAPVAPVCSGDNVAVVDQDGLASVLNVGSSSVQYQFQISQSYQLNPVNIDQNGRIYAATYEGYLMCVTNSNAGLENWDLY